jgi:lipopolysaccharide transport system ATP-binding protein
MSIAISLEEIGKQYRLGLVGTNTLRGDITSWWYRKRGLEDPTLQIGSENRLDTQSGEYVWALRDINLDVKEGEILGIIGKNGAGKSTLLKILSRVTGPTTGQMKVKGRIASLLEVGTGFHPELTGRENIFLNGAILGMTKTEIKSKFDEIVDFSGVAKYIDTPVKRYSSGMYVRLAFAVAAHLDPEILIVDEVLAVGDADFQKKAIGKMQDISKDGGRTVLFVSHNMASVQKLCTRGVMLENGIISFEGNIMDVIDRYTSVKIIHKGESYADRSDELDRDKKLIIRSLRILNEEKEIQSHFERQQIILVEISLEVLIPNYEYTIAIELWNSKNECLISSKNFDLNKNLKDQYWPKGMHTMIATFPSDIFKEGQYYVTAAATIPIKEILDIYPEHVSFNVKDISSGIFISGEGRNGNLFMDLEWEQKVLSSK